MKHDYISLVRNLFMSDLDTSADGLKSGRNRSVILSLLVILFFFGMFDASAQSAVTGTVLDEETGEGLPGVTVTIRGIPTKGTVTDLDGKFTIDAYSVDVLVFSSVGFMTQQVEVGQQSDISVTLTFDIESLEEVVVIGYGTKEKNEVTSAVSQISSEKINQSSALSISNALAGQVPGLIVTQTNAEPGRDEATIRVRGIGTTENSNALIVVDGIANRDGISRIDPNDIETITVLKDASAAIYGAQAANGVILITTKRGEEGKPTFNYSFRHGLVSPTRKLETADASLYARSVNAWNKQTNGQAAEDIFSTIEIAAFDNGILPSTDWIDEVYKDYSTQNRHNLSVRGGTETTSYFISLGMADQNGLVKGDDITNYQQYNVRSNLDVNVTEGLKIGVDLAYRDEDRNFLQFDNNTIYSSTIRAVPTIPALIQGMPARGHEGQNPLAIAKGPGYLNGGRSVFNGTLRASMDIPGVEGLSVGGFAAVDIFENKEKYFFQPYTFYSEDNEGNLVEEIGGPTGSSTYLREGTAEIRSVTLNARINYKRSFGNHNISAFVAYEQNQTDSTGFFAQVNNYETSTLDQFLAGSASSDDFSISGGTAERSRQNYLGRFSYDYAGKYLMQFHFRYDGSPIFPEDGRFGFFPGISAGWRISEEDFLRGSNFLYDLKLRASWGQLGNDRVRPFQYLSLLQYPPASQPGLRYVFDGEGNRILNPGVSPNPGITWETKTTLDVGVDASFMEGKISLEFDVFFEKRRDILTIRNATVPNFSGIRPPEENIGEIDNNGFDGMLSYKDRFGEFTFSIGVNFTYAKSKVIYLDDQSFDTEEDYRNRSREGYVVGAPLLYTYLGIYQTQEDIDNFPSLDGENTRLGDPIFADINNDGELNALDRKRFDYTSFPQFQYGLPISFGYKNFDLSLLFQGQAKAKSLLRYSFSNGASGFTYFLENTWTEENQDAIYPAFNRASQDDRLSTLWLRDVSFLRLRNIELGYNLPEALIGKIGLESVRVYLNGFNLITFDQLAKDGLPDPESIDLEGWQYPHTKSINFGVNVSF